MGTKLFLLISHPRAGQWLRRPHLQNAHRLIFLRIGHRKGKRSPKKIRATSDTAKGKVSLELSNGVTPEYLLALTTKACCAGGRRQAAASCRKYQVRVAVHSCQFSSITLSLKIWGKNTLEGWREWEEEGQYFHGNTENGSCSLSSLSQLLNVGLLNIALTTQWESANAASQGLLVVYSSPPGLGLPAHHTTL